MESKQPYSVNLIANFVILFAKEQGTCVNNLKLQKILFYLEARFLLDKNASLFSNQIEKWEHGPVIPDVYDRFYHLGAEALTYIPVEFDFLSLLHGVPEVIEPPVTFTHSDTIQGILEEDKLLIKETVLALKDCSFFDLVDATCALPSWRKYRREIKGESNRLVYSREEMKNDFISSGFQLPGLK